jgi:hypothetical protein
MIWRSLALSLLLAGAALAEDDVVHVVTSNPDVNGSVTPAAFDRRIEEAAKAFLAQHPQGAVRIVQFDSAYPLDIAEYRAMHGYGVLLLTSISQDETELPLTRAYIDEGDGVIVALQQVSSERLETPEGSLTRQAYGPYREDAFFIVPLAVAEKHPRILCDFARNRSGFIVNDAPFVPDLLVGAKSGTKRPPDMALVYKFLAREYPGFPLK